MKWPEFLKDTIDMSEPCNLGGRGLEQMMFSSFEIEVVVFLPSLLGKAPLTRCERATRGF